MSKRDWPNYAAVWRWHFYAGIFCIPFVIVLSITGTIYLFRPQIEAWQESELDRLPMATSTQPLVEQISAAVASVDGGKFAAVEKASFADSPFEHTSSAHTSSEYTAATRVLVDSRGKRVRVYVDPSNSKVLKSIVDKEQFIGVVKRIHGELLLGKKGSYLVELAASWTIVMVITGLVLWLPRKMRPAGVLYPRVSRTGKTFWKDLHSVGGFWASGLILFLVATGLPWSTFWGDYFKSVRRVTGTAVVAQHWDGGHEEHADHQPGKKNAASGKPKSSKPSWMTPAPDPTTYNVNQIDRVATFAATVDFLPPVSISPPTNGDSVWSIKSETANRPHQQTIRFDAEAGKVVGHDRFTDRHWVDQLVGQGIALHEGQRFGWLNQLIALAATTALVMLSMSGLILWWRRRDGAGLSPPANRRSTSDSPPSVSKQRLAALALAALMLAVYLPLFGASMIIVLALDWLVFSRFEPLAVWLGRRKLAT